MMIGRFKYILIKLGDLNIDGTLSPIKSSMIHRDEWEEFTKNSDIIVKDDVDYTDSGTDSIIVGDNISTLSVGKGFTITSLYSKGVKTSTVVEIYTPNVFRTINSIYFLIDDNWKLKTKREEKLNEIFNGKFEEVWNEISDIDKTDDCLLSESICKLVEELGEMTTEINKLIGRKSTSDTIDVIKSKLLEESADTFQNFILICNKVGIKPNELLDETRKKNEKWKLVIPNRKKIEFQIEKK